LNASLWGGPEPASKPEAALLCQRLLRFVRLFSVHSRFPLRRSNIRSGNHNPGTVQLLVGSDGYSDDMNFIALKMLIGDRAKYFGIIIGLTFASLLITQQSAIFVGIMTRTFSFITDVGLPDIWVVDPQVQYIGDIKPLGDTELLRVRGMEGIEWAVPLYLGTLDACLPDGTYQSCIFVGLDDETLIGGPATMVAGNISNLRQPDGGSEVETRASSRRARRSHRGSSA
jgi:hypothetical protein